MITTTFIASHNAVTLEEMTPEHAPELYPLIAANSSRLVEFGESVGCESIGETYRHLVSLHDRSILPTFIRVGERAVGYLSVQQGRNADMEIAYWLDKSNTGKGYATMAVRAITAWLHSNGTQRVIARVSPINVASRATLQRAGYEEHEGYDLSAQYDVYSHIRQHTY